LITSNKILALSPHTDDIELGCAGTLSRMLEQGSSVHVVNFSRSKNDKDDDGEKVAAEFVESMEILGATYEMLDLPTRRLHEYRQDILDYMYNKLSDYDLVFCHSSYDNHQDHKTVQQEAFRAYKNKTILGYELPWNCMQFSTDFFVKLEKSHIDKKIHLLNCYKSQSHRAFINKQYVKDIARTRGLQVQAKYAECFELIRGVI
jgi:LmbE family N-acetylglucosaminyl deacetylase